MILAGWQPVTLIDYPGRVAATLFTAGCNLRCPFCHNPELVLPDRVGAKMPLDPERVLEDLKVRGNLLDGVVVTGGEPTLHDDLEALLESVRALGYFVKLDTNGTRPDVVRGLIVRDLVDFVAVDVKAPKPRYAEFCGIPEVVASVEETIGLLKRGSVKVEFRTTVAPGLTAGDVEAIAEWIGPAPAYVLQRFRVPPEPEKRLLDPTWAGREALDEAALRSVWSRIADRFETGGVRA